MTGQSMIRARADDRGSVSVYIVVLAVPFLLLAGLVVDGGGALVAKQRAGDEAEQAARAGANAIDVDELRGSGRRVVNPALAQQRVAQYFAGVPDVHTSYVDANTVHVTVTVDYAPTILSLVSGGSFHMTQSATAIPLSP